MKEINLTKEDSNWKIIQYPDGQQDIELNDEEYRFTQRVRISSRINSWKDIELILCTTAALERLEVPEVELYIPYLIGARCDRLFKSGGTSYLRDVISPVLNAQGYKRITVVDVHNPVATDSCINKLRVIDNSELVKWALKDIGDNYSILCPDEGASKKIYPLLEKIGYKEDPVVCSKKRVNGKIVDTNIGNLVDCQGKDMVIVDDICDGGRTFIEIAKKLQLLNPGNMYLIVTHGIFSAGYEELSKWFKTIYCTNSVSNINNPLIKQMKVI